MTTRHQTTAMAASPTVLRAAGVPDLAAINRMLERAIMTWKLPERVKRLSLPAYLYDAHDLGAGELVVLEDSRGCVVGAAAWQEAAARDAPEGYHALQLHGIYVDPEHQRRGYGSRLLFAAERAAMRNGYDGLLVKAQAGATGFFLARGMRPLEVGDAGRDYPHRYWKCLAPDKPHGQEAARTGPP